METPVVKESLQPEPTPDPSSTNCSESERVQFMQAGPTTNSILPSDRNGNMRPDQVVTMKPEQTTGPAASLDPVSVIKNILMAAMQSAHQVQANVTGYGGNECTAPPYIRRVRCRLRKGPVTRPWQSDPQSDEQGFISKRERCGEGVSIRNSEEKGVGLLTIPNDSSSDWSTRLRKRIAPVCRCKMSRPV